MKLTIMQFKNGIFYQNPVFVLLLGMCPVLAVSKTVETALGMGAALTAALVCCNALISLLRKLIPDKIRIASYIVIITTVVCAAEMIMKAWFPVLSERLGIFIPLIAVNCIVFARAEIYASKNTLPRSIIDGMAVGIGFTLAVLIVSVIREILGNGTVMGYNVLPEGFSPALIMALPPGGFLALGFVIALMQKIMKRGNPV